MIKNESEIWKSLPGISGVEVSMLGRVRTLDKVVSSEKGTWFIKGRVLKQREDKYGYLKVGILIDGKQVMKLVHRLVAQTFISNPDNLPQVNHKDCNRKNNNVENLEFCSASYNAKYREKYGISNVESQGHPLFAVNLKTLEVSSFQSQAEASRVLGISHGNINSVISGRYKQTCGYWFTNANDNAADAIKNKLEEAYFFERTLPRTASLRSKNRK